MKNLWSEFLAFIKRGNVLDMAIGFTVGASFTALVQSLVNNLIMPIVSLILGVVDFSHLFIVLREGDPPKPYATLADAEAAGALTWRLGTVLNSLVSFLILALVVFFVVRAANKLLTKPEPHKAPTEKPCPYCKLAIPMAATRCPHCTSQILPADAAEQPA